jgi:hypothetical protein
MSRHAESVPTGIPIPGAHAHAHAAAPMDASKLNHTPAPLPPLPSPPADDHSSPPLRSPDGIVPGASMGTDSSAGYLEEAPAPSHPTVAETGALSTSPGHGPGPSHGQLQRRESQVGRRIIRLASFGGEGLVAKPPLAQEGDLEQDNQHAVE